MENAQRSQNFLSAKLSDFIAGHPSREGYAPRRGRRNFCGGPRNGSHTAHISSDSPRRIEATTEPAVAACHDLCRRPGGVDEAWVSFAAAPAGRLPLPAFPQKCKLKSLSLGVSFFREERGAAWPERQPVRSIWDRPQPRWKRRPEWSPAGWRNPGAWRDSSTAGRRSR